jgi:NAD-dependent dihydropyrimidine dehydrogenase PreA subunit
LEEKNYILEKLVNDQDQLKAHLEFLDRFQGNRKVFYMDVLQETIVDTLIKNKSPNLDIFKLNALVDKVKGAFLKKFEYYHGSKVMPLDDALKVIDIPERIYLLNCVCKQIYDGEERASCLCFNALGDIMHQYPDYHVKKFESNLIGKEEAKELLRKEDSKGSIHCIYYYIMPYIGALCNCSLPFCPNLKNYIWGNIESSLEKSGYIVSIDSSKCVNCREKKCVNSCNFGAIKIENGTLTIEPEKCFGCGLCRNGCNDDAIILNNRE